MNSLYNQLLAEERTPSVSEILNDLKGTLMAGFDTSARGVTTTIFRLLKNPEKMQKLKEALNSRIHVDSTGGNLTEVLTMEAINDLDYL